MRCYHALWLALMAFVDFATGQSDPTHQITRFHNLPARLCFFDNTNSVIYHDSFEGNVHVSGDEGKTWNLADIPPGNAERVVGHPFNNRIAFVLTSGTIHYRTEDKGQTWRSFKTPVAPAPVQQPLSFHSDPDKYGYILFQGTICDRKGWSVVCHDETFYTTDAFSTDVKKLGHFTLSIRP